MSKTEFPFIVLTDTHDQSPKSMSAFTVHSVKDFLDFAQEEADWSYIVYNETKLEESFGSLEDCQDEVVNGYDCYGLILTIIMALRHGKFCIARHLKEW